MTLLQQHARRERNAFEAREQMIAEACSGADLTDAAELPAYLEELAGKLKGPLPAALAEAAETIRLGLASHREWVELRLPIEEFMRMEVEDEINQRERARVP